MATIAAQVTSVDKSVILLLSLLQYLCGAETMTAGSCCIVLYIDPSTLLSGSQSAVACQLTELKLSAGVYKDNQLR